MDASSYSPAVRDLLSEDRLFDLGPGRPNETRRQQLAGLTIEKDFAPTPVRRTDFAEACLSALWLYHDFLNESHSLSQSIATVEGSYWHGILHRREPDYANGAYWFRQVGHHPVFDTLGPAARQLAEASGVKPAIPTPWDPFWFIDYCQACTNDREPGAQLARLIQKREWELLFAYCYERAVA
jgi:hypothetical protein